MSKDKSNDTELKIWCAVRTDLEMPIGKFATQVGHGYVGAVIDAQAKQPHKVKEYIKGASPKITVGTPTEDSLLKVYRAAVEANIPCALIKDAGRTVFAEPTYTVCAFGPCLRSELPPYLKRLQLLKD